MPARIQKEGVISVFDFFQMFPDADSAQEYIEIIRWAVTCAARFAMATG